MKPQSRGWHIVAIFALAIPWLGVADPGEAAQIRMINCTDQKVKVCNTEETDEEILQPDAVKHFTCSAKCAFRILECEGNKCGTANTLRRPLGSKAIGARVTTGSWTSSGPTETAANTSPAIWRKVGPAHLPCRLSSDSLL